MNQHASYLSISQLNALINETLEVAFPEVQFQGEISQVTIAGSGHIYFTLKDAESQISAVMWRGMAATVKFKIEAGTQVLCHGRPNLYAKSGRFQIVVHRMLEGGAGALQRKFLELKEKLEREGLFAPERKRELPFFPTTIAVVTSPTGAVIHDIMTKIRERMPGLRVLLAGVRVQGEGAAEEIARAIEYVNTLPEVEVVIVARGGGSLEDLWAFNEERVVRAIFASRVPVISGVGHEVDVTLADLAADVRAPTPTAAAEMVVPQRRDLLLQLAEYERRLGEYSRWLSPLAQHVDELTDRLSRRAEALLEAANLRISAADAKIKMLEPVTLLARLKEKVAFAAQRFGAATEQCLHRGQQKLETSTARLEALSPLGVLKRGYAVVFSRGRVVTSGGLLAPQELIDIRLAEGAVHARVEKVTS